MQLVVDAKARNAAAFVPVLRPHVAECFRKASEHRIVLIVAPPGFGKSVAIRQHLEVSGGPHILFVAQKQHGTFASFVRGLLLCLEVLVPNATSSFPSVFEKGTQHGRLVVEIAAWISTILRKFKGTVVFEDLHHVTPNDQICELLSELLDRTPEGVRWMFSTRSSSLFAFPFLLALGQRAFAIGERDLRLTDDDAALISRKLAPGAVVNLQELLSFTQGWPAAFHFAIQATREGREAAVAVAHAREALYDYLADQVFRELRPREQKFLLDTCLTPSLDIEMLESAGFNGARESVKIIARLAALVSVDGSGIFRYHDLFRDFLETRLRSRGDDAYQATARRLARALELGRSTEEALRLYLQAGSEDAVTRILVRHSDELLGNGAFELIETALSSLNSRQLSSPVFLLLNARVNVIRCHDTVALAFFEQAMKCSTTGEEIAHVAWRYAAHLLQRRRFRDALVVIEIVDIAKTENQAIRTACLGTKSAVLASLSRAGEANLLIDSALKNLGSFRDDTVAVTVLSYAAFVKLRAGMVESARRISSEALESARRIGMYGVAAAASSILYEIALDCDDIGAADSALKSMLENAESGGDRWMRAAALLNIYGSAAARGSIAEMDRLESDMRECRRVDERLWFQCAAPSMAMRISWQGDFREAHDMVRESALADTEGVGRIQSLSELALYASACLNRDVVREAIDTARAEIQTMSDSVEFASTRLVVARLMIVMAELVVGNVARANRLLRDLEFDRRIRSGASRALIKLARGLYELRVITASAPDVLSLLAATSGTEVAGVALTFNALPIIQEATGTSVASLSAAELRVLRHLGHGKTSREIGIALHRSPLTIDTQIRSLLKKLGLKKRRQAAEFAREQGLC
jgi:ATP/maltotriose-dependent transcriptional regulator MalT